MIARMGVGSAVLLGGCWGTCPEPPQVAIQNGTYLSDEILAFGEGDSELVVEGDFVTLTYTDGGAEVVVRWEIHDRTYTFD